MWLPALGQDTALRIHPADSLVDKQLVGDWIVPVIQFFFQQPPWVMWGGVAIALVLLFFILRWFWPRRQAAATWLRTRSRNVKFALVGVAGLAVLAALGVGYSSYHFVETDSRFCSGCHIFVPSDQPWVRPDTGWYTLVPRMEGKHDTLNCHTCHPLKPIKEGVKLVFWMSGVRDEHIPEHARVPRRICEDCHVQGAAKEEWQAIAATAGHRAHLESDSSALKDKVECLTCHARTAHRFQPADTTCVQDGCHLTDDARIQLGKMADQSDLHCTVCHVFTKPVVALATRDSAAGALRPGLEQCFSCHEMKGLLPGFSAPRDPHEGTCGMCHNPHTQVKSTETNKSCTTSGCHDDWRSEPFHTGAPHRAKAQQCTLCHDPHQSKVDASDCTGCHSAVRGKPGIRLSPPLPFDTLKALRSFAPPPPLVAPERHERPSKVKGDAPPGDDPPRRDISALPSFPSDTFSHPTHKKLACLTCHLSKTGEKLTFEAPRGCQICHHQAPQRSKCADCHSTEELPEAVAIQVRIAAAGKPARERSVAFRHETHKDKSCINCHTERVSLAPADSVTSCTGCHSEHHETGRDCASCHRTAAITQAHARPVKTHVACDACHATAAIAPLEPKRTFCLACHPPVVDHNDPKECSACHLIADPAKYRSRLLKRGSAG
jgi:hypothetical protein